MRVSLLLAFALVLAVHATTPAQARVERVCGFSTDDGDTLCVVVDCRRYQETGYSCDDPIQVIKDDCPTLCNNED